MRIAQIAMALLLVIAVFSSRAVAIDAADYWVRASAAITLNAVAELEALVAAHPDLCTDNRPDTTEPLLVYAASCKNGAESVQTLLKLGAKPNQFDSRGDHYAIQHVRLRHRSILSKL